MRQWFFMLRSIPKRNISNKLKLEKMRKIIYRMVGDRLSPVTTDAIIDFALFGFLMIGFGLILISACLNLEA